MHMHHSTCQRSNSSTNEIGSLGFHPAGAASVPLLYCAQGRSVHVLDVRSATSHLQRSEVPGRNDGLDDASDCAADSAVCSTASGDQGVRAPVVQTLAGNKDEISCLAVDPTGSWLVAGDDSGEVWCAPV